MKTIVAALLLTLAATNANAQKPRLFADPATPTFTATLSNNTPLAFGMGVADAQRALGTPFTYVSGRPGNEIFLTFRDLGGSGLFPHHDRLFLQFRKHRLTGWKADWGENWMWR
ncbi:hypothetical protein CK489_07225 [Bradyrhizobium sp. UFLA03-84]|uniref:hypothetical protein n=1 Tax=Bradyrhizobium sp. UFLA03-84 TaxID=418599 RepID=UPI000BAE4F79|nr:hypothetical protein [Bradyrhizobium sp. UFLA03-84]PAY10314.1 hypothetical protein CK489_07225 [Bradyrhizobium sp. UFLA03-84]